MNPFRLQSSFVFFNFSRRFSLNSPQKNDFEIDPAISNHIYYKYYSKSEIIDYLLNNIVYNKDNIIATSKPHGLTYTGNQKPAKFSYLDKFRTFTNLTFDNIKDELAEKLDVNFLKPLVFPHRNSSGLVVLATSENTFLTLNSLKTKTIFNESYKLLTIVIGKFNENVDNTFFSIEGKSKRTKNKISWQHEVISSTEHCSLLKVLSSSLAVHFTLASRFRMPVLGDLICASKIKNIFGVPHYDFSNQMIPHVDVPEEILKDLDLNEKYKLLIPAQVHLQAATIPYFDKCNFSLSVPPPDYFLWSCQKLKLLSDEVLQDKMKIMAL